MICRGFARSSAPDQHRVRNLSRPVINFETIFRTFLLCFYSRAGKCLLGVYQNDSIPIVTVVVVMKS